MSAVTTRATASPRYSDAVKDGMGVAQHYQTITGTSEQNVADDQMRRLTNTYADGTVVGEASIK